jgi:hypothetical protein
LALIAAGTRAAAALSTVPEPEEEALEGDDEPVLEVPVEPPAADELPGLLPLPQPAAVRASVIAAAPTMTALEVLPARMCSPPVGDPLPAEATFMGYGAGILAPANGR